MRRIFVDLQYFVTCCISALLPGPLHSEDGHIHQLVGVVVGSGHPGKKADMPVRLVNNNKKIPYHSDRDVDPLSVIDGVNLQCG